MANLCLLPQGQTLSGSLWGSLQKSGQESLPAFVPWRMSLCCQDIDLCGINPTNEKPKRVPAAMTLSPRTLSSPVLGDFVFFPKDAIPVCGATALGNQEGCKTTERLGPLCKTVPCSQDLLVSPWRNVSYLIRGPTPQEA